MEILEKLEEIKIALEAEEKRKNRFQGKLDAKMESLEEMGLSTVSKAKAHLKKLEKELQTKLSKLDTLVQEFENDFPDLFEE